MDARFSWHSSDGKMAISLWGSNLLDEEYYTFAWENLIPNVISRYWEEPRRYGLEFTYNLGK